MSVQSIYMDDRVTETDDFNTLWQCMESEIEHYEDILKAKLVWQNLLNYPGSSAQAITIKATPAHTHFKRNNSWSVG